MKLLFCILLFSIGARAAEGVSVNAIVDRNQVGVGDTLNLQITISAKDNVSVNEPNLGNLPGFELINTSSGYETRSSYENGRFVTETARTFTYMLAAARKGSLTIPDIPVTIDGQTYRTKPITIAVSDARKGPPAARNNPTNPFDQQDDMEEIFQQMLQRHLAPNANGAGGAPGGGQAVGDGKPINPNEAFVIQAETDKTKAYVGEQVTANIYLLTRGQLRDIDTLKYPDLKGFWKEDLEMATRLNFENVTVNGIPFQRALLVSYALFPIRAGKAIVDPYKAKCTVLSPTSFGFGRPYQFTKASAPITIEVQDVPANKPADYTGAVGDFRVSAQFEPPTGTVNQPVTLRVRFEGRGNAKLIDLPKLDLPPSFELYDQKNQAKYMKDGTSFKEFEVLIIPREPGVFKVPAVTASTFDPRSGKFTQISSKALEISVTGTATTPAAPAAVNATPTAPAAPAEPTLPPLSNEMTDGGVDSTVPFVITILVYLATFAFLIVYGLRRLRLKPKKQSLRIVLKRRLGNVRAFIASKEYRRVGVELTNTAYYILGQLSEQGGASQELHRLLEHTAPSLRNELAGPIQKILDQCEALSFAPEALIADMTEKNKLAGLVQEFEKVMSRAIDLAEI